MWTRRSTSSAIAFLKRYLQSSDVASITETVPFRTSLRIEGDAKSSLTKTNWMRWEVDAQLTQLNTLLGLTPPTGFDLSSMVHHQLPSGCIGAFWPVGAVYLTHCSFSPPAVGWLMKRPTSSSRGNPGAAFSKCSSYRSSRVLCASSCFLHGCFMLSVKVFKQVVLFFQRMSHLCM